MVRKAAFFFLFLFLVFSFKAKGQSSFFSLYCQGRYQELESLLRSGQDNVENCLSLALLLSEEQNIEEAVKVAKNCYKKGHRDKDIIFYLGRFYYLNGNFKKAISFFKKAAFYQEYQAWSFLYLGLCYQNLGFKKKALVFFQKARQQNLVSSLSWELSGLCYEDLGKYKLAIYAFEKALKEDASLVYLNRIIGELLYKVKDYQHSLFYLQRAYSFLPQVKEIAQKVKKAKSFLGKKYFVAQKQKALLWRLKQKAPLLSVYNIGWQPLIRIRIIKEAKQLEFKSSGRFKVEDAKKQQFFGRGGTNYLLVVSSSGLWLRENGKRKQIALTPPLVIKNLENNASFLFFGVRFDEKHFWSNQQKLAVRGFFKAYAEAGKLEIVNYLGLEEYLYGVLASEMPSNWPLEALKAQAVAARTKAVFLKNRRQKQRFDLESGSAVQVYKGVEKERKKVIKAVNQTRGQVLTYHNQVFDVFFSSNCGGCTKSYTLKSPPYYRYYSLIDANQQNPIVSVLAFDKWLRQKPAVFCAGSSGAFRWQRFYPRTWLEEIFSQGYDIYQIEGVKILARSSCGRVKRILLLARPQNIMLSGSQIRKVLHLRSSFFKVETQRENGILQSIIFLGAGFGHGIGMCQYGAKKMAQEGYSYQQILSHYYKRAKLKKLY